MTVPVIETERLILREFREEDFPVYERLAADIDVMRYLGGKTMNQVEAWRHMAFMIGHWTLRGYGYFAVEEKTTREFIGRAGFMNPTGWPGFELDRDHVISLIHADNSPSRRVAERLGETLEGETEVLGMPVQIYGIDRTRAGTATDP